jgi:hypothetical protein
MRSFATIKRPTEDVVSPAGFRFYRSRTFSNAAVAITKRQSISTVIDNRRYEVNRSVTSQSPFLVPILKTVAAASRSVRSLSRVHTWKEAIASVAVLALLTGCDGGHQLRVGSPQFQHAPELTCIVMVEGNTINVDVAKAALDACKAAIEREQKKP